jgi:hypothetical protein
LPTRPDRSSSRVTVEAPCGIKAVSSGVSSSWDVTRLLETLGFKILSKYKKLLWDFARETILVSEFETRYWHADAGA